MRISPWPLILVLAACSSEPSFDERYGDMANTIQNQASDIDNELDNGAGTEVEQASSNDLVR